jgi:hypothetical protein
MVFQCVGRDALGAPHPLYHPRESGDLCFADEPLASPAEPRDARPPHRVSMHIPSAEFLLSRE